MPVPLADDLLDIVQRHAAPLAAGDRDQFIAEVVTALGEFRELGVGLVARTCREIQPGYVSRIVGSPRHPPRVAAKVEVTSPKRKGGHAPGRQWERPPDWC